MSRTSGWPSAAYAPVSGQGTYASRPAATTVTTGYIYYATDVQEAYRATGTVGQLASSWTVIPPGGSELAYAQITASQTGLTGATNITGLNVTVVGGDRPLKVEAQILTQLTSGTNCILTLTDATASVELCEAHDDGAALSPSFHTLYCSARVPPLSGATKTYQVSANLTGQVYASTTIPSFVRVTTL